MVISLDLQNADRRSDTLTIVSSGPNCRIRQRSGDLPWNQSSDEGLSRLISNPACI
jgi:hypothetical protein